MKNNKNSSDEQKVNKNVERLQRQIDITTKMLQDLGIINHCKGVVVEKLDDKRARISWDNHKSGRVGGSGFLKIEQYVNILEDSAYLALLKDYSIIRCSFVFDKNELINESLLWWPCPFSGLDRQDVERRGIAEVVKEMLTNGSSFGKLDMRSPIRIDYDSKNDNADHPGAHMHIEHDKTRINTGYPICFNRFMSFILMNFYHEKKEYFPEASFINYAGKNDCEYINPTKIEYKQIRGARL